MGGLLSLNIDRLRLKGGACRGSAVLMAEAGKEGFRNEKLSLVSAVLWNFLRARPSAGQIVSLKHSLCCRYPSSKGVLTLRARCLRLGLSFGIV